MCLIRPMQGTSIQYGHGLHLSPMGNSELQVLQQTEFWLATKLDVHKPHHMDDTPVRTTRPQCHISGRHRPHNHTIDFAGIMSHALLPETWLKDFRGILSQGEAIHRITCSLREPSLGEGVYYQAVDFMVVGKASSVPGNYSTLVGLFDLLI